MTTLFELATEAKTVDFYPTPFNLAKKMLEDVDFRDIKTVLEPSAGKGNLLKALALEDGKSHYYEEYNTYIENPCFDVDCIELDENLRSVLQFQFSEERKKPINERLEKIIGKNYYDRVYNPKTDKYDYPFLSEEENKERERLDEELEMFFDKDIKIVGNDFLVFFTYKKYDLILMNPPFSNGDEHLLKAIEMQQNGGNIICLLNAETIRNPYSNRRKVLVQKLKDYNAHIEYVENAFSAAEKSTDVEVAIIKIAIPKKEHKSEFLERCIKAEKYSEPSIEPTELALTDFIEAMISRYKVECNACVSLINEYEALKPYIQNQFDSEYSHPILELKCGNYDLNINKVIERVRNKYWSHLLHNEKFIGKLTSDVQNEFYAMVNELAKYEFNSFNIYNLASEINSKIKEGIEETIIKKFDEMTQEHTWYDGECKNIHYFNGWKTNKAHKVNNKVILPINLYSYGSMSVNIVYGELSDLEKIMNYFDGNMTTPVNLITSLQIFLENHKQTKNIPLKFFDVTFYKKGTCHIKFHKNTQDLIDRFNIYCCKQKGWLPPSYGTKHYNNLNDEEKAVVDSFHGENAKKRYEEIIKRKDFFLAPPIQNNTLMLVEGESE